MVFLNSLKKYQTGELDNQKHIVYNIKIPTITSWGFYFYLFTTRKIHTIAGIEIRFEAFP